MFPIPRALHVMPVERRIWDSDRSNVSPTLALTLQQAVGTPRTRCGDPSHQEISAFPGFVLSPSAPRCETSHADRPRSPLGLFLLLLSATLASQTLLRRAHLAFPKLPCSTKNFLGLPKHQQTPLNRVTLRHFSLRVSSISTVHSHHDLLCRVPVPT